MWEILGIEPTDDIKEIKRAYAKLAKQYNPEEHPEEFQRIFDAYKRAVSYAKRLGGKKAAPVSIEKSYTADESNDETAEEYSFSDVDLNTKCKENIYDKSTSDEDQFHFPQSEKSASPQTEKHDESKEDFDFSGIRNDRLGDEEIANERLRTDILRRIKKQLEPMNIGEYDKWYALFTETYFSRIVNDAEFRIESISLLKNAVFPKNIANLIAYYYGDGSSYYRSSSDGNNFRVAITLYGKQSLHRIVDGSYNSNPFAILDFKIPPKVVHFTIAIAALMFALVFFILFIDHPLTSAPPQAAVTPTVTDKKDANDLLGSLQWDYLENKVFENDELYPHFCREYKIINKGRISLSTDHTFTYESDGEIITGSIETTAGHSGPIMYGILSAPDTFLDNAHVYLKYTNSTYSTYYIQITKDDVTHTGIYVR